MDLLYSKPTSFPLFSPPSAPRITRKWTVSTPCCASRQTVRIDSEKKSNGGQDLISAIGKGFTGLAAAALALAPVCCESPPAFAKSQGVGFPVSRYQEVGLPSVDKSPAAPPAVNGGETIGLGKQSWPELVGAKGKVAAATIEAENPFVKAVILLDGAPATQDYRTDRVRVVVDKGGFVVRTPVVG